MKRTGTKKAEKELLLRVKCACCDATVQLHLGAKVYLHDFHWGDPYSPMILPLGSKGDRVILCLACANDAERITRAGLRFVEQALREAKEAIIEENTEPDRQILADFLEHHRYEPGAFLDYWRRATAGNETDAPDDDEGLAAFDQAQMLSHYREALESFEVEERKLERQRRLAVAGLRVVSGGS